MRDVLRPPHPTDAFPTLAPLVERCAKAADAIATIPKATTKRTTRVSLVGKCARSYASTTDRVELAERVLSRKARKNVKIVFVRGSPRKMVSVTQTRENNPSKAGTVPTRPDGKGISSRVTKKSANPSRIRVARLYVAKIQDRFVGGRFVGFVRQLDLLGSVRIC